MLNLRLALRSFQNGRGKNTKVFQAIDQLHDSPELLSQFRSQIKTTYGINPDNLRALLQLFLDYAPQIIALILKLVGKT